MLMRKLEKRRRMDGLFDSEPLNSDKNIFFHTRIIWENNTQELHFQVFFLLSSHVRDGG